MTRYAVEKGYDVVRDFFGARALRQRYADRRAKVITSIAMFYDLEDPAAFVRDVADSLAEDGVWVMELHYLPLMLKQNAFDVIVHEHLEYYSLAVLERLFAEAGLEVVDGELNDINGGSIRLFIAHAGRREPAAEAAARLQELRDPRVRDGAGLAGALRAVRAQRRAGRARAEGALRVDRGGGEDDPRRTAPRRRATRSSSTRELDRRLIPLRRRPQPRQVGLRDPHRHTGDQRGGVARDAPRLLPRAALALPRRVPERERDYLARAAGSSSRCPRFR